jgi:hypothetical protein
MASTPYLRSGIAPPRPTTNTSTPTQHNAVVATTRPVTPLGGANPAAFPATSAPRRLILPTRYMDLEPPRPLSAINDDPVFNARAAASILGVSVECLTKWRQRGQGPDYIQYGEWGPVRYALSALMKYRAEHTILLGDRK